MKLFQKIKEYFVAKKKKSTAVTVPEKADIKHPDELTPEEIEKLAKAFSELAKSFPVGQVKSLEEFLKDGGMSGESVVIPFLVTTDYSSIDYEMETHLQSCEHWNDLDFVEFLLGFYNIGYDFDGFDELFNKVNENEELSESEKKQLEQWYLLVSMEQVVSV